MTTNVFISRSKVPPVRWREAFPEAVIVESLPPKMPEGALLWLHNLAPADFIPHIPRGVRVIALHDEPKDENGLAALSAGAVGFANAHSAPNLLQTIESVVRNDGLWVGESLLSRLLRGLGKTSATPAEDHPALNKLSDREREVALKVVSGECNKEIARDLGLADRTVKAHLSSVFDKLGVRDRLQLALLLKAPTA